MIKSYLMSLRHFVTFLISDTPDKINFNIDDVNSAREEVQMWSLSYKRESSKCKWQKLEDTGNRLTPKAYKHLKKVKQLRGHQNRWATFGPHRTYTEVTQASYTLVRDFLFTQIFIDNANRSDVLADMTMEDYKEMQKEDGHYIITVMVHKAAYVHGPACVILARN